MAERRFLEDNENMEGKGKPQQYAASNGNQNERLGSGPPTTWMDWLGICGMMLFTYLVICLIWVVCRFNSFSYPRYVRNKE